MGYTMMKTRSGQELLVAAAHAEAQGTPLAYAILDLTIPGGIGGQQVLAEFKKKHPNLPGFATSGYSEDPVIAKPQDYSFARSLRKLFLYSDLAQLLNAHLKQS
jgi:DNA-binding NtrC family response regulator